MADVVYESDRAVLIQGDAVDAVDLIDGAELVCTDPPYGVRFRSGFGKNFRELAGDDGTLDVAGILGVCVRRALPNKRHVYVFGYRPDQLAGPLKLGSTASLVWDKGNIGMGDLTSPWAPQHEPITFGCYVPSKANRDRGDGRLTARLRQGSVIRVDRPNSRGVKRHPTEKPVALMRQLIESSTVVGETVLDPFAGSGSTLVAALLSGRRAVGVEIDPQYTAVAVARIRAAEKLADAMGAV